MEIKEMKEGMNKGIRRWRRAGRLLVHRQAL